MCLCMCLQAFEEGGGGARAVAHRILAEAKAVADKKGKQEGPDPRYSPMTCPLKHAMLWPVASQHQECCVVACDKLASDLLCCGL